MKDRIVGRPIRLNRQILVPQKGQDFAEVIFLGDIHYGSPQFDKPRFLAMLDYCIKKNIYVFLMGDLIEMSTRDSIGAGVYEQEFIGQNQFEQIIEWLTPLSEKKLLLGSLTGNHEERVYARTGIDIGKMFAIALKTKYLGNACWSRFTVGSQNYSIYGLHGRTGSRFDGTALLALERISTAFFCDLIVMGHAHKMISSTVVIQKIENSMVKEHKKYLLITGSYLKYDGGYAQTVGLPISKLGSPKVKFYASKKDIVISW
jgi:predicted phosphodiesterase